MNCPVTDELDSSVDISDQSTEPAVPEVLMLNFCQLRKLAEDILAETSELPYMGKLEDSSVFQNDFHLPSEIRRYEIKLIEHALKLAQGSQVEATKMLGIGATTLNTKIKRYKIPQTGKTGNHNKTDP